uniref:UBA domain-containing protein n=1 Tax=Leersia perrieri TaxID=77586 RepID=A0A0D9VGH6_9ORYZ
MAGTSEEAMNDLIARFMDVTKCDDRDAAAVRLASCNGSIEDAVGLYFAVAAATAEDDQPVVHPPIPPPARPSSTRLSPPTGPSTAIISVPCSAPPCHRPLRRCPSRWRQRPDLVWAAQRCDRSTGLSLR